ncbi:BLUF domain-containing protein [Aquimarina gracilis]|uniref:BLUF domain-containing protein n=1 Tax=Aquimarina gracilis TaxID=874422 RepID=A0ABU5ZPI4_9FLAO|nr:BLUF domain-containing protein [Aquimarina gracilis]MEB3343864.1 BLUF domain-containing protein [Aquimarina gracilis]
MRYTISYVSTVSPDLSETDIADLMSYVKQHNNFLDITGILIYSDGNFLQVLEGEKETVKILFERIKKDPRHYNIIKMLDKEIKDNAFSKYHSSFTVISGHYSHTELQQFLKKEENYNPEHFKSISYLTQKFMKLL